MLKLKLYTCVFHKYFGPLYINGSFRDSGGKVWMGINGLDGVSYQFYASECDRIITREEFDSLPKGRQRPDQAAAARTT